jgi:hypothetical protein
VNSGLRLIAGSPSSPVSKAGQGARLAGRNARKLRNYKSNYKDNPESILLHISKWLLMMS